MKNVPQIIVITAAFIPCAFASQADARPFTWTYPSETHGIWFDANPSGREQCRAYKKANKANKDEISSHLVGSVVISSRLIHYYAEYGEGDFYEIESSAEKTGRQGGWRMLAYVGIDERPDRSNVQEVIVVMKLSRRKLHLRYELVDGPNIQGGAHQTLSRCADVPEDMYNRMYDLGPT
jgi:hypothetical protein